MKCLAVLLALAGLSGCGVETATTAATGAVIKQQEMDAGKKAADHAQTRVEDAIRQMQQRDEKDADR